MAPLRFWDFLFSDLAIKPTYSDTRETFGAKNTIDLTAIKIESRLRVSGPPERNHVSG